MAFNRVSCDRSRYNGTFSLSNGESCAFKFDVPHKNEHYTFKPNKKITKVEVFIIRAEDILFQINFYSGQERLVRMGAPDSLVKICCDRREFFEIDADE